MNYGYFNSTDNPAAPAAIDKALTAQLAGICQAMSIIHLTSESLLEPDDFQVAAAQAHEALNGVHALLDGVLVHLESVSEMLRGKVAT